MTTTLPGSDSQSCTVYHMLCSCGRASVLFTHIFQANTLGGQCRGIPHCVYLALLLAGKPDRAPHCGTRLGHNCIDCALVHFDRARAVCGTSFLTQRMDPLRRCFQAELGEVVEVEFSERGYGLTQCSTGVIATLFL